MTEQDEQAQGKGDRQREANGEEALADKDDAARIKSIIREILSEQAESDSATEQAEAARAEQERKDVADVVGNANTLAARKTAVASAVETARDSQAEMEIVAAAVKSTEGLEAKKAAAAQAVASAEPDNKVSVAQEAVEQLTSQQQQEVASRFLPSREAADKIWVIIVRTFAIVLVVGIVSLVGIVGLAVFRDVDKDLVQIMLTVFSTVAGILAGFITGQAVGSSSANQ